MERPPLLEAVKQWYKDNRSEFVFCEDPLEADDLLGLNQIDTTCIVSIDKDMLTIPGWHYNYVKDELYKIDSLAASYNFYHQILVGDSADNIKGAKGIGKVKAEQILKNKNSEEEMLEAVRDYFSCDEELEMIANVLWIQRKGRVTWNETGISKGQRQEPPEDSEGSDSSFFFTS